MPLYRLTAEKLEELPVSTFAERGIRERTDLQRMLREKIDVIDPNLLVISEEFAQWDDSKRRIDLLAIDSEAKLVVIELKRSDDGGHMELQAIRYAAMISRMLYRQAIDAFQRYLDKQDAGRNAEEVLSEFLGDSVPSDDAKLDTRILLVSADFAKELTTAVLWLNEQGIDIRCVRAKPYIDGNGAILDVQQIVPLPEAAEYQVAIREETITRREIAQDRGEPTGYWFMNVGELPNNDRSWDDCRKYGYISAGATKVHIDLARKLRVGDKLFAYLKRHGYVGYGEVVEEAVPIAEFVPEGYDKRLPDLPMVRKISQERIHDPSKTDWCVRVDWIKAVDRSAAVLKDKSRQGTLHQIKKPDLVSELFRQLQVPTQNSD